MVWISLTKARAQSWPLDGNFLVDTTTEYWAMHILGEEINLLHWQFYRIPVLTEEVISCVCSMHLEYQLVMFLSIPLPLAFS